MNDNERINSIMLLCGMILLLVTIFIARAKGVEIRYFPFIAIFGFVLAFLLTGKIRENLRCSKIARKKRRVQ